MLNRLLINKTKVINKTLSNTNRVFSNIINIKPKLCLFCHYYDGNKCNKNILTNTHITSECLITGNTISSKDPIVMRSDEKLCGIEGKYYKESFHIINDLNKNLNNLENITSISFNISLITFPIALFYYPFFLITIPSLFLCRWSVKDAKKIKKELIELRMKKDNYN
jgi:hypothetical protein